MVLAIVLIILRLEVTHKISKCNLIDSERINTESNSIKIL